MSPTARRSQVGDAAINVIAAHIKAFAAGRGVDVSWASTDQVMRLHQYNIFPNMTLLANADHLTVLAARPGPDPDHGELVMMLWMRMALGAPRCAPADVRLAADEAEPGLVLTQDISVLAGLQRGLHQPGLTHVTLSNEERRVINMHRNLDRYLDLPESPTAPERAVRSMAEAVSAGSILDTAAGMIERHGVDAFTMRGLGEELGVAVTSIYWHVGGRDKLFDSLVDRLLSEMAHLPVEGATTVERIASLARSQRRVLIDRQHLLAIAHERDRTPMLFLPIQQALAGLLAELGVAGTEAALVLRAVQVQVISSAVMQFSAVRGAKHEEEDPSLWDDDWPDQALVQSLQSPTDYDAVFEYGLSALLATLPPA